MTHLALMLGLCLTVKMDLDAHIVSFPLLLRQPFEQRFHMLTKHIHHHYRRHQLR
ncbi:hypothetical protein D3C87_2192220 [compost metagenome]